MAQIAYRAEHRSGTGLLAGSQAPASMTPVRP
jgi:hypothetical protein